MKGKLNHASLAMTGICIILGFIIGIQIKTVKKQMAASNDTQMQRVNELSLELSKLTEENENLTEKVQENEEKIREYENAISDESQAMKLLKEELENVRKLAGMTELKGRGITVTINDSSKKAAQSGVDTGAYLVHAEDILSIINELNVAGAEAISINGQRIISTSSVRCVGPVVNVNGVRVAAPFVITAIGSPDVLESALKFPGGVVESLAPWGIEIVIRRSAEVTVPSYSQSVKFVEAYSAGKEEGE